MKFRGLAMLVLVFILFGSLALPQKSEAQIYSRTVWYKSVTTAVDTTTFASTLTNATVTIFNYDSTNILYVWTDSVGSSAGLDTNRFIPVQPRKHVKIKGSFQKIYRKAAASTVLSMIVVGDVEYGQVERWQYSPPFDCHTNYYNQQSENKLILNQDNWRTYRTSRKFPIT